MTSFPKALTMTNTVPPNKNFWVSFSFMFNKPTIKPATTKSQAISCETPNNPNIKAQINPIRNAQLPILLSPFLANNLTY